MDFSFNARTFRSIFHSSVDSYARSASPTDDENAPAKLIQAMEQAIDVMERADADAAVNPDLKVANMDQKDISQIGDYALTLLEGMVGHVQQSSADQERELMRLTIPVALWISQHGGKIEKLDLVVNSLAGYANDLRDTIQLAELCRVYSTIINAVSDNIRQDLEQTNSMRPWRILNLNYGIVATRSHDPALIEQAYSDLAENLPQDAREFFREGMQQMDVIGYPQEVREIVEKYDRMWGSDSTLH